MLARWSGGASCWRPRWSCRSSSAISSAWTPASRSASPRSRSSTPSVVSTTAGRAAAAGLQEPAGDPRRRLRFVLRHGVRALGVRLRQGGRGRPGRGVADPPGPASGPAPDPQELEGICGNCVLRQVCRGACRSNAYDVYGSLTAPAPNCQHLYEAGLFPESRMIDPRRATPYPPQQAALPVVH